MGSCSRARAPTTLQQLFSFCPWAAVCAEALQNADCHGRSVSASTVKPWAQPVLQLHSRRVALSIRTDELINQKLDSLFSDGWWRSSCVQAWLGLGAEKEHSAPAVFTSSRAIGWSKSLCRPLRVWTTNLFGTLRSWCKVQHDALIVFSCNEEALRCTVHCPQEAVIPWPETSHGKGPTPCVRLVKNKKKMHDDQIKLLSVKFNSHQSDVLLDSLGSRLRRSYLRKGQR